MYAILDQFGFVHALLNTVAWKLTCPSEFSRFLYCYKFQFILVIGNLAGSRKASPYRLSDADAYYSTFHKTPERKSFSEEEWENFTRGFTKKAVEALVSSPDFTPWAVANAERLTLTPTGDSRGKMKGQQRRWLNWL